jgi:hypothetical protein
MPLFRRPKWNIAEVPRLDLEKGTRVDIGFLGGEQHREAFASLFAKVFSDNPTLATSQLDSIDAERPVSEQELANATGKQMALADADLLGLARILYDSRNETVFLNLSAAGAKPRLGVRFDDPEFWLESPAA